MNKRLNFLSILIVFALVFSVEIPYMNRMFFMPERYSYYQALVFFTVNILSILGISFLLRGIIFDIIFLIFTRAFDKYFEVIQLSKFYKPILFMCTIFLYAVALSGEVNYFFFCILVLCFQISTNSQKIFIINSKAYYIDDYSLNLYEIQSFKLLKSNTIVLNFQNNVSRTISFSTRNIKKLDAIRENLTFGIKEI